MRHIEVECGGFLPATVDSVALYLADHVETLSTNILRNRLAGLAGALEDGVNLALALMLFATFFESTQLFKWKNKAADCERNSSALTEMRLS